MFKSNAITTSVLPSHLKRMIAIDPYSKLHKIKGRAALRLACKPPDLVGRFSGEEEGISFWQEGCILYNVGQSHRSCAISITNPNRGGGHRLLHESRLALCL